MEAVKYRAIVNKNALHKICEVIFELTVEQNQTVLIHQ